MFCDCGEPFLTNRHVFANRDHAGEVVLVVEATTVPGNFA
jgi:hypothetical protein